MSVEGTSKEVQRLGVEVLVRSRTTDQRLRATRRSMSAPSRAVWISISASYLRDAGPMPQMSRASRSRQAEPGHCRVCDEHLAGAAVFPRPRLQVRRADSPSRLPGHRPLSSPLLSPLSDANAETKIPPTRLGDESGGARCVRRAPSGSSGRSGLDSPAGLCPGSA